MIVVLSLLIMLAYFAFTEWLDYKREQEAKNLPKDDLLDTLARDLRLGRQHQACSKSECVVGKPAECRIYGYLDDGDELGPTS